MSIFENIKKELEKISKYINLSKKEMDYLLSHKSIQKADLSVNGSKYPAWRILHNNVLGPGKGGIRFHPDVSEDEVKALSFWMSIKNSLLNLPYGGAKGGVKVNPQNLSKKELEEISRKYIKAFCDFLGQDKDIPAPDVYTNSQIMAWMLDEFEKLKDRHEPGMITGKPIELGGCQIRNDATSKGGVIALELFLERFKEDSKKQKISIQGFGNAGMNVAKMLHGKGYNISAVSDSRGAIKSDKLDIEALIEYKKETGSVADFNGVENIKNEEILETETDILILAALEDQITKKNANNIKAKYILELANGPITFNADEILIKKGIIVIPDIFANAGGVVASYCEWMQNKTGHLNSEETMSEILERKMTESFHSIYELYQEEKNKDSYFNLRTAAYILAIKKILSAAKARGKV